MDLSAFPIDADAVLARLRRWVACESPSWDAGAVSAMVALAGEDLRTMGAAVRLIPGEGGYGDCALAEFDPADKRPGILILGHLDTVHPKGSLSGPMPWRIENGRCFGPGAYDMKGGIVLALEAYAELRRQDLAPKLPVRALLTSDEESGSPSTRRLIERTATGERYVFVPEGAEPNGNLVSGRYPTSRFQIWTHGKASHALLQREEGRSAISAMARILPKIEALHEKDCSVTVTCLSAGHAVSTVPVEGYAEVICTAKGQEHLDRAFERLQALGAECGVETTVKIKTRRPTWTPTLADVRLWELARELGRSAGLDLQCEMLFGGSDGNITGAIGITTLDALGPVGGNAHQLTESVEIASIVPRGRLVAGLLATVA